MSVGNAGSTAEGVGFEAPIPRDPAAYSPTQHLIRRHSPKHGLRSETRTNPPITGDVIDTCISSGEATHHDTNVWELTADVDGVEWVVKVTDDTHEVLTAFAPAHHDGEHTHDV